jgi:hypothetical protein
MYPHGAAQNTNVSLGLFARMAKKRLMMSATINLNASPDAAIRTLRNALQ